MIAPTPYFSDRGCHVRIYEEVRALEARGHTVQVVAYHLGQTPQGTSVARIPNIPWYRKLSAGPSWHKPYLDILLLYKALAESKRFQPDLVHAHLHEGAFLAALAKRSFGVPVLFDCQGSLTGELLDHSFVRNHGLRYRFFAKLESWINQQADHIVTSSTVMAEKLSRSDSMVASRVTALPDGVDTEVFRPWPKDLALLEELGISPDKKLIVYLGAMTEYQGLDLLLETLGQLADCRNDVHALLMGYPEAKYVEKARRKGLMGYITFTGKINYAEAPRYLGLRDLAIYLKVSETEANGKLLNYMACGLPCVVFDNPVNRELLGDVGCYAKQESVDDVRRVIVALLDQGDVLAKRAVQIREHAIAAHAWQSRAEMLERIYDSLLSIVRHPE